MIQNSAGEKVDNANKTSVKETSHIAGANVVLGDNKTNLGRFENAESLLRAYNSLESEFTRRSQKLKELEREVARIKETANRQTEAVSDTAKVGYDFWEEFPEAEKVKPLIEKVAKDSGKANCGLERAYLKYLLNEIKNYESEDYLFTAVKNNGDIKNGIIREYLEKLNGSKPSARLISGNGSVVVAPPQKPKTLQDASALAMVILEKAKEIK